MAAAFLTSTVIGAKLGGALAVATAEAICFVFADPIAMYVVLKVNKADATRGVLEICRVPLIAGAVAVGLGALAGRMIPTFHGGNIVQIAVISAISTVVYIQLIRRFAAEDWKGLLALVPWRRRARN
jgi:hypothetical protein